MNTATIQISKIELNEQILFSRPNCLVVCRIVEMTEKAVKVDYCLEPISMHSNNSCIVYNYSTYIPKSVILNDKIGGLTVKKWFENNFKGGFRIKPYFLKNDSKVLIK
jgi:hypothetical protein